MLLSFLPPSCMVKPIRELANITHSTISMANNSNNLTPVSDINMVIDPIDNIFDIGDNFENERGCSLLLSMHKHRSRSPSISSSKCSEKYHVYVQKKSNRMDKDKPVRSIGSIKLEYKFQRGKKDQISKATDSTNNIL